MYTDSTLQFLNFDIHQSLYPHNVPRGRQAGEIPFHSLGSVGLRDVLKVAQQGTCDKILELLTLDSPLFNAHCKVTSVSAQL